MIPTVAKLLAVLTVVTDIGIIFFLVGEIASFFIKPIKKFHHIMRSRIAPFARILAFIVALTATSGSLFFSEIAHLTPCLLCWYQRILMYPQVLLIGLGIIKNDKNVEDYAMGFSLVGGLISLYHYYIQLGGNKLIPCSTVGFSVDCTKRFSLEFGYITIPMMALSAFVAIILLMYIAKKERSSK